MTNSNLINKLEELHQELASIRSELESEEVDEQTVEALGQLVSDVSTLVDRANATAESTVEESEEDGHQHVSDQIRKLESDHPRVTRFLSELTDLLGMIGI